VNGEEFLLASPFLRQPHPFTAGCRRRVIVRGYYDKSSISLILVSKPNVHSSLLASRMLQAATNWKCCHGNLPLLDSVILQIRFRSPQRKGQAPVKLYRSSKVLRADGRIVCRWGFTGTAYCPLWLHEMQEITSYLSQLAGTSCVPLPVITCRFIRRGTCGLIISVVQLADYRCLSGRNRGRLLLVLVRAATLCNAAPRCLAQGSAQGP